jgi:hypothetical protein
MSLGIRFIILTFIVVGLYLLVRNSALYNTAIGYGAQTFSKAYRALVTGQQAG